MAEANTARPVTIGIVAGEASGDALGAELIHAVRKRIPGARFAGIGGSRMESAGCALWYPMSKLALAGYAAGLSHLPGLGRGWRTIGLPPAGPPPRCRAAAVPSSKCTPSSC